MTEDLVVQADAWGFICECATVGRWQIYPTNPQENWKLQRNESRWLLIIKDVPQVSFSESEARLFLKRRKYHLPSNKTLRMLEIEDQTPPENYSIEKENLIGFVQDWSDIYYN